MLTAQALGLGCHQAHERKPDKRQAHLSSLFFFSFSFLVFFFHFLNVNFPQMISDYSFVFHTISQKVMIMFHDLDLLFFKITKKKVLIAIKK